MTNNNHHSNNRCYWRDGRSRHRVVSGSRNQQPGISNTKLAMWVFLLPDCLLFGALITSYFVYRGKQPSWSVSKDIYDIPFAADDFVYFVDELAHDGSVLPKRD